MSTSPFFECCPDAFTVTIRKRTALYQCSLRRDSRGTAAMTRYLAFAALAMVVAAPADADTLDAAAEKYRPSMIEYIDQAFDDAKILREGVAAHDLAGAKRARL